MVTINHTIPSQSVTSPQTHKPSPYRAKLIAARDAALTAYRNGDAILPLLKKEPAWKLLPQKVTPDGALLWKAADGSETTINTGKPKTTWKLEESTHPQPYTEAEIRSWFDRGLADGWGERTGAINGIIGLDTDNAEAEAEAVRRGWPETHKTQTGRGFHRRYTYDPRIKGNPYPGCDLRTDGGYLVGPGSLHPNGGVYTVVVDAPIAEPPAELIKPDKPRNEPNILGSFIATPGNLDPGQAQWIASALAGMIAEVASTPDGNRNNALNLAALRAEAYQKQDPRIDLTDFWPALENAAVDAGLERGRVRATIASGRRGADPSEMRLPDWWFERVVQSAPISRIYQTETAPAVDIIDNVLATASTAQLPDSDEKAILYIWERQGAKVAQAIRVALSYAPNEFISLPDLEKLSGVSSLWRAIEKYGGKCLFETKFHDDQDLSYPYPIPTTHDQSEISQPVAEKPATLYRIKPRAERVAIYLDLIGDRLVEKHRLKTGKAIKRHLKALVGDGSDPTLPDDIAPRVWAGMTADERTVENKAIAAAKREYQQWVDLLPDETITPLPETPNGATWKTDYRGAIQARSSLPALGKQQPWSVVKEQTTFSAATARRTERRIGITRDEVFHPTGQTVQPGETLPDLEYNNRFGGFPALVTALTPDPETGECKTFDYRSKHKRQELAALRHNGEIGAVRIDYQQASIPRLMTDEEKQAYSAQRQKPTKLTSTRKQETRPIDAPHIGPGVNPAVASRWLNWAESVCKLLPIATGLSIHERILKLAGRTPIPSDTDWCADLPGSEVNPMYDHSKVEDRSVRHAPAQPDHPAIQSEAEPEPTWITIERGGYIDDETKALHTPRHLLNIEGAVWCAKWLSPDEKLAEPLTLKQECAA